MIDAKSLETAESMNVAEYGSSGNVRRYLDLSTAHVQDLDSPNFGDFRVEKHEYGWIMWTIDPDWVTSEFEVPPWLRPIVDLARKLSCSLILFDRDAETLDGLAVYESA